MDSHLIMPELYMVSLHKLFVKCLSCDRFIYDITDKGYHIYKTPRPVEKSKLNRVHDSSIKCQVVKC